MKHTALVKKKSSGKGISTKRTLAKRTASPRGRAPVFAVCVENDGYQASLERYKIYRVLPDADAAAEGDTRIIDESGEDYLYPAEWFVRIQPPAKVKAALLACDEDAVEGIE